MGWLVGRHLPILTAALACMILIYALTAYVGPSATGLAGAGGGYHTQGNTDLKPTAITYLPIGPQTGDLVNFTITVKNIGGTDVNSAFPVSLYIDGANAGNTTIPSLAAGTANTAYIGWTATSELHDVYAVVDGESRLNSTVAVDWPTFRQSNERWGVSYIDGPVDDSVKWTATLDAAPEYYSLRGQLAAADGLIIIMTSYYIFAYDADSGAQIWNHTSMSYSSFGSPIITNGILYVAATQDNKIYAFNVTTGSEIWSTDTGDNINTLSYSNGKIFHDVANEGLYARDATTGGVVWNFTTYTTSMKQPAINNGTIFIPHANTNFTALDADSGSVKWHNVGYESKEMWMASVAYGNAYFALGQELSPSSFYSVRTGDGSLNWTLNFTGMTGAPFTIFNGTVIFGTMPNYTSMSDGIAAIDAFTGTLKWAVSIDGEYSYCAAVASNNGIYYIGLGNSTLLAISAANGSTLWSSDLDGAVLEMTPYKGKLYVASSSNTLYAFGEKAGLSMSQTYNDTIIDRDEVTASIPDSIPLSATISDGTSGITTNFYVRMIEPDSYSDAYIGSNDSLNGDVTLEWNPVSSFRAGRYLWFANSSRTRTLDNSAVRVHGGLSTRFRYSDSYPALNYSGATDIFAAAFVTFPGGETLDNLIANYSLDYNVILTKPDATQTTFSLNNVTEINVTTNPSVATGTGAQCYQGASDWLDTPESSLVPDVISDDSRILNATSEPHFYLRFTCDEATCPGHSGREFHIIGAYNASDNDDVNDELELEGWDACTDNPGSEGDGWDFTIFSNTTAVTPIFWNGSAAMSGSLGTWYVTLIATADFFITNDTVFRNFTIAGTEVPAGPGGGGGGGGGGAIVPGDSIEGLAYQVTNLKTEYKLGDQMGFNYKIINPSISHANVKVITTVTKDGRSFWSNTEDVGVTANGTYWWIRDVNDPVTCSVAVGPYSVKVEWLHDGKLEKTDMLSFSVSSICPSASVKVSSNKFSYNNMETAHLTIFVENTGNVELINAEIASELKGLKAGNKFTDTASLKPGEKMTIYKDVPLEEFSYGTYTFKATISQEGTELSSAYTTFIVLESTFLYVPGGISTFLLFVLWKARKPITLRKRSVRTAHSTNVHSSLENRTNHFFKDVKIRDLVPSGTNASNVSPLPSSKKKLESGATLLEWRFNLKPKQRLNVSYRLDKSKRFLPGANLHYRRDRETEMRLKMAKKAHAKK